MEGIHYWIEKRAQTHPHRIAIITETEEITYKQLNELVKRTVTFLTKEKNIAKGERIAILSHNRLEFVVLLFAIAKIECVAVPLNVRLNMHELAFQLNDSGTKLLFFEHEFSETSKDLIKTVGLETIQLESIRHLIDESDFILSVNESAPYIICYTSGTTGKPKGAVLTQKNMHINAINNAITIDLTSYDRTIVLLPLFHIGGIGLFAFPTLFTGGTILILGKFDPSKALQMMEKYRVTVVMGVPAIHQALIESTQFDETNLASVRWFYSGGAPCPHSLIKAFFDKGFLFGQGFGLTETSPTVFLLSREDAERKIGSVGKPVLYCNFKIIDEAGKEVEKGVVGNLIVSGGNVMKEYWNNPAATKEALQNGWFHTGDLARLDEEGFVYIVGRKKEMIISGGENIYPLEVEVVINQLEEVSEVAVVGMSDERWGEVPIAFVAVKKGEMLTERAILTHCKNYLGRYKVPKKVIFVQSMPRNSTGKIQKNNLLTIVGR